MEIELLRDPWETLSLLLWDVSTGKEGTACSSHLYRLNDEDALKKGHDHGHQPAYGALLSELQPIKHSEKPCYHTGGEHEQPAHEHKPPGQPRVAARCLRLTTIIALCRSQPVNGNGERITYIIIA